MREHQSTFGCLRMFWVGFAGDGMQTRTRQYLNPMGESKCSLPTMEKTQCQAELADCSKANMMVNWAGIYFTCIPQLAGCLMSSRLWCPQRGGGQYWISEEGSPRSTSTLSWRVAQFTAGDSQNKASVDSPQPLSTIYSGCASHWISRYPGRGEMATWHSQLQLCKHCPVHRS